MQLNLFEQIRSRLDKWRLCLLCFIAVYAAFLVIDLSYKSLLWDEGPHFIGGLLLSRGDVGQWIWTNSFYPPMFDMITATYFIINGSASVFAGRLVSVTFAVLSVVVIYAIAEKMYGSKTAIVSAILFGVMPGIVWVSRMAMIETMLIFIFTLVMLFFFRWLQTGKERDRIIFTAIIIAGVAVKYQMLVLAPIVVIAGMYFWKREYLKSEFVSYFRPPRAKYTAVLIIIAATVSALIIIFGLLGPWLYAMQIGTADKAVYSLRFPIPIYYLIEMTWPNNFVHPISLLLYLTGLAGISLFALRRKQEDKLLLLWFATVYLVFTFIPNREWRYVTVLFPVLAISAASIIITGLGKLQNTWKTTKNSFPRRSLAKLGALMLIGFTIGGVSLSCADAYNWVSEDHTQVPIGQAVAYVEPKLGVNETLMVACPLNQLNMQMVWFYLNAKVPHPHNNVTQYPAIAVDAYTPDFNISEFIDKCAQNNTKYVLLYEHAEAPTYFNTTLNMQQVYDIIIGSGRFTLETEVGTSPRRIFIMTFE